MTPCCCNYGSAVSGEWPEFECAGCVLHDGALGDSDYLCKRHKTQSQAEAEEEVARLEQQAEVFRTYKAEQQTTEQEPLRIGARLISLTVEGDTAPTVMTWSLDRSQILDLIRHIEALHGPRRS